MDEIPLFIYPDGRMDPKNAARYLGKSVSTLAMMRCHGNGPEFIKRGKIWYFKEDLDIWLRAGGMMKKAEPRSKEKKGG